MHHQDEPSISRSQLLQISVAVKETASRKITLCATEVWPFACDSGTGEVRTRSLKKPRRRLVRIQDLIQMQATRRSSPDMDFSREEGDDFGRFIAGKNVNTAGLKCDYVCLIPDHSVPPSIA